MQWISNKLEDSGQVRSSVTQLNVKQGDSSDGTPKIETNNSGTIKVPGPLLKDPDVEKRSDFGKLFETFRCE